MPHSLKTHMHTQVKPQIPWGLLYALHTWRLLISGCCLTPFNRIPLVLGFLCSAEDTHATSPERVSEGGVENEKWGYGLGGSAEKN